MISVCSTKNKFAPTFHTDYIATKRKTQVHGCSVDNLMSYNFVRIDKSFATKATHVQFYTAVNFLMFFNIA